VARRLAAALLTVVLIGAVAGCSEGEPERRGGAGDRGGIPGAPTCGDEPVVRCAPDDTVLGPLPDRPRPARGEPIRVVMLNQETGPGGSFPELSLAARAAFDFVNQELGGIDGRPVEIEVCDTKFSAEQSLACAQRAVQQQAVAVLGGIDLFGNGIRVLEQNELPYVGGIPVSIASATSPVSFQFSGGTWGAVVAFLEFARRRLDAERVAIIYGEFGSIENAAKLGERIGRRLGVDVRLVSTPIITTDYVTPMTAALDSDPDAIVALTADVGCVPTFRAAKDLRVRAAVFFTGACAAPKILEAAGREATEGRYFNVEGPINPRRPSPDTALYNMVIERYGRGVPAQSAGTVTFRAAMNLYMAMRDLGADRLRPAALMEWFRDSRDRPSFTGHPYTCDGRQLPEQPAMCAPQQIIAQRRGGTLVAASDWIDVPAIVNR
jgi:branched-chain amino acid transport system substrate-binding protein